MKLFVLYYPWGSSETERQESCYRTSFDTFILPVSLDWSVAECALIEQQQQIHFDFLMWDVEKLLKVFWYSKLEYLFD